MSTEQNAIAAKPAHRHIDDVVKQVQTERYVEEQRARAASLNAVQHNSPGLAAKLASGAELLKMAAVPVGARGPFLSSLANQVTVRLPIKHEALESYRKLQRGKTGHVVKGRFSTKATLLSSPQRDTLTIKGPAALFLTGQDLQGIEDVRALCAEFVQDVLECAGIDIDRRTKKMISTGDYDLVSVGFAAHCDCLNRERAKALMVALRDHMVGIVGEFGTRKFCEILFLGQRSKHRTLKIQQVELGGVRPMPPDQHAREFSPKQADALVRFELTMHRAALESKGLGRVADWSSDVGRTLFERHIRKFVGLPGIVIQPQGLETLSEFMQPRLKLWLLGDNTAFDDSKDTYRRHRKTILDATGIDIRQPVTAQRQVETVAAVNSILHYGFGYRDHSNIWEQLKQPSARKRVLKRAG